MINSSCRAFRRKDGEIINSSCRAFRRKDGEMIANFRVQADLKGMETTTDGRYCLN